MNIDWNAPAAVDESTIRILTQETQVTQAGGGERLAMERPFGPDEDMDNARFTGPRAMPRRSIEERIERLEAGIRSRAEAMPADRRPDEDLLQRICNGARSGLAKIDEGQAANFTKKEAIGVEAVVIEDQRPSLFVKNGFIDLTKAGDWQGLLETMQNGIKKVIAAVGGIRIPQYPDGPFATAFVISPGLVVTNRHVLEAIAKIINGKWILNSPENTVIDFVGEVGGGRQTSFKIRGVAFAAPNPINRKIDFKNLDLAVLQVDQGSDAGFPDAVSFEAADVVKNSRELCVIGFPAKVIPGDKPTEGTETMEVIDKVFDNVFGVKQLAPGKAVLGIGEAKDLQQGPDVHTWVFTHDASTLHGNSGSCVIDLAADKTPAVGIHFGGIPRKQNWAHAAASLQQQLIAQGAVFV